MSESVTPLETARQRVLDFLKRVDRLKEPGAILGGDNLPETTVFECVAETWPGCQVVHVDSSFPLQTEDIRQSIQTSFAPGRILLMTITRRAGKDFFRFLEQLLVDGYLEVHDGTEWKQLRPPEYWRLVIHSRPGRFPLDEAVASRLAL
jgi:hypothetical protein